MTVDIQSQIFKIISAKISIKKEKAKLDYNNKEDKTLLYSYLQYEQKLELLTIYFAKIHGKSDKELQEKLSEMREELEDNEDNDEEDTMRFFDEDEKKMIKKHIKDTVDQLKVEGTILSKYLDTTGMIPSEHTTVDEQAYYTFCQQNMIPVEVVRIYFYTEMDKFIEIVDNVLFSDEVFYELNTS